MVIIPGLILSFLDETDARTMILLTTTGHVSLLPLLFRQEESLVKILLVWVYGLTYLR